MALVLIIAAVVFAAWHVSVQWGKGGGIFALLLLPTLTNAVEWTPEQVAAVVDSTALAAQNAENTTAVCAVAVGLICAHILTVRIRFK